MRRSRPSTDARLALSLLTVVPGGAPAESEGGDSASWFPAVGLMLGATLFGLAWSLPMGMTIGAPALVATLVVTFEAAVTRMLHYDGIADVADAWWGGATTARRLEIMKDSATGAFGTTAVVIAFALQATAISTLLSADVLIPLLFVAPLARLAATCAAWFGVPARDDGLGRSVMGRPALGGALATLTVIAACGFLAWQGMGVTGAVLCGAGIGLALVVPHLTSLRMGGVTGDVMGASVLIVQTVLYVAAALAVVAR